MPTPTPTTAQQQALKEVKEELSTEEKDYFSDADLLAFVLLQRSPLLAVQSVKEAYAYQTKEPMVTMKQVSQFFRCPPGAKQPPGCVILLEDCQGDCARDAHGRPIVVVVGGMLHGTVDEMTQQVRYLQQRIRSMPVTDGCCCGEVCVVLEVQPREPKQTVAFRLPEPVCRQVFDLQRRYYPGSQFAVLNFCGVPYFVAASFHLAKVFMSAELRERLLLKSSYAHLPQQIPDAAQRLYHWEKGTLDFDIDAYVEWRAQEEGLSSLRDICERGHGRCFDTKQATPQVPVTDFLGSDEKRKLAGVIKHGLGQKQGSGSGFFSSRKWKKKLLVCVPSTVFYFDSMDVSDKNVASRVISLEPLTTIEILPADKIHKGGPSSVLQVHTMGRDFDFGFESENEAQEWKEAIEKALK